MKAIELLQIVNEQCTPETTYQIYHKLDRKLLNGLQPHECFKPIRDFFLGEDKGECLVCKVGYFLYHNHFVLIFLDKDSGGELYHDFYGCWDFENPIFEGINEFGQHLRVYPLE